jgi:1,4-dihydroxy-2-naphthoate octaprenyltransferase
MTSTTNIPKHPIPLIKRWQAALVTGDVPEIDKVDSITKWLLITRASVFSMTFTSGMIGVLLAAENGQVNWLLAVLSILGIVIAHASNNIMNDLVDYQRGIDTEDYPRTQYGPHPILSGLSSTRGLIIAAVILNSIDAVIMVYLTTVRGPWIIGFAVIGLILSFAYTGLLKRFGLGELTALIVWGPLMIGGSAFAASGELTTAILVSSLPYGLIVASVLVGKHIDKIEADDQVGVRSLPVLLGHERSLLFNKILFILFFGMIFGLVILRQTGPWILLTLLAIPRLRLTWKIYSEPKPEEKPDEWPVWPLWYVGWAMYFNRRAGELLILGLFLNIVVPRVAANLT